MEQSGRNQWQLVANGNAQRRLKQAETVATDRDQLPIGAHGKEGVDGSSPSEGSAKAPEIGTFPYVFSRQWAFEGPDGAVYGAFASRTAATKAGCAR
jgi:hypothetical protein